LRSFEVGYQEGLWGIHDQAVFEAEAGHQTLTLSRDQALLAVDEQGVPLGDVLVRIIRP
jgi:hypothetical protein